MATIDEAVATYVAAIRSMDIGTLMATLTPDALGKAMAQMGSSPPPTNVKDIKAEKMSEEDGEFVYHLVLEAHRRGATMMTPWKEIDGAWKLTHLRTV